MMNEKLQNQIVNMTARCNINSATVEEDGTVTLKLGLLDGEDDEDLELMQQYGFASVPLKDAEGFAVFPGGDRSSGVVIATEDQNFRLVKMEGGEVALYTDEGDVIHFKRGRILHIETETMTIKASKKVTFDTPILEVSGEVADGSGTLDDLRGEFNGHGHPTAPLGPISLPQPVVPEP